MFLETGYVIILDQQTLIQVGIQLINTIILCFLLAKILYKPVLGFLNDRKKRIANQIDSANSNFKDAEELKARYEKQLDGIARERDEILAKARNSALKNSQDILIEAKKEAKLLKDRALNDIQREQEKVKDEIKQQIIDVSTLVSSKFVAASISEAEQNKLIDDTISDLEGVKWLS